MISAHLIVCKFVDSTRNIDELVPYFIPLIFGGNSLRIYKIDTSCFKISYSNCSLSSCNYYSWRYWFGRSVRPPFGIFFRTFWSTEFLTPTNTYLPLKLPVS